MRYDTPVYFRKLTQGEYDPTTGDYGEDTYVETCVMASLIHTKTETMQMIYGNIAQNSLTIHIQNHYHDAFDFDSIRIGTKIYKIDYTRKFRTKQSFVVHEVK